MSETALKIEPLSKAKSETCSLLACPVQHPTQRDFLSLMRLKALDCRVAARTELNEAYAILSKNAEMGRSEYLDLLLRVLEQGLGRRPVLYRPGVYDTSFDEAWILRAIDRAAGRDWCSLEFLIKSRVLASARRPVAQLIVGLSKELQEF